MECDSEAVFDLSLSCTGLRALDKFSHSDPLCVLKIKSGLRGDWSEIGRTESIKNCGDPEWSTSFTIKYYFHQKQSLRFCLYDVDGPSTDLDNYDNLGTAESTLGQILAAPNHKVSLNLSPYKDQPGDCGVLHVSAAEISDGTRDKVTIDLTAQNLDKKDLFSESDPFYCLYRVEGEGSDDRTLVYRSEWIKNTASPDWAPVTLDCAKLCLGDWTLPLRLEVFDWDYDGGHDFIGVCTTSLEALSQGEDYQIVQLDLVNPKKLDKRGYADSGQIIVKSVKIEQDSTFLDYIRGGLKINLSVCVDLSGGDVEDPTCKESLHYLDSRTGENVYTTAIRSVVDILQDYDYDRKILGLGFGSQLGGVVRHCYPLNDNPKNPYCKGVDELLDNYKTTLENVLLGEPTCFKEVLEYVGNEAQRNRSDYSIILLITDGAVSDFDQTKDVIVKLSKLPVSVVLVGVGNGDMSLLETLDQDKARLSSTSGNLQASRDIVQFVDLKKYIPGGMLNPAQLNHELEAPKARFKLARAVLQEIPRQVVEFMRINKIPAGVADIPYY